MAETNDHTDTKVGRHERAADGLSVVIDAIDAVDLNTLLDDDVRALLAAKATVTDMCLRARQNQHARRQREADQ